MSEAGWWDGDGTRVEAGLEAWEAELAVYPSCVDCFANGKVAVQWAPSGWPVNADGEIRCIYHQGYENGRRSNADV